MMGSPKLCGDNQNNKRARTGFGDTLPLDIQSSNPAAVAYGKQFGARDEDVHDLEEGE